MTLQELEILKDAKIQNLIKEFSNSDPVDLLLKDKIDTVLPPRIIAEQIAVKQKADKKFPSLNKKNLIFTKLAYEQSSSEATAKFKATITSGNSIIDLTGGLGIDEVFLASSFNTITYCEINQVTSEIAKYNFSLLGTKNITVINTDSIEYLKKNREHTYNWLYIDPSRRDSLKRSVDLEYCAPNVYQNMELFFKRAEKIMIKVAPAFDLSEAIKRFINLTDVYVLSVDGECKEILLILDREKYNNIPKIHSVSLSSKNSEVFSLTSGFIKKREKWLSELKSFFYEPDCAIIKSELSPILLNSFELGFINRNTPYLTSEKRYFNFPGRKFEVKSFLFYNEKELKKFLRNRNIKKANIARRDFNLTVNEIRKRFKLKEGGDLYLFFTKDNYSKKIVIICEKLKTVSSDL